MRDETTEKLSKQEEDDREGDDEDRVRGLLDAHELGDGVEPARPDRQDEQGEGSGHPQQGVALGQAPPADEVEDEEEDREGDDEGDDLRLRLDAAGVRVVLFFGWRLRSSEASSAVPTVSVPSSTVTPSSSSASPPPLGDDRREILARRLRRVRSFSSSMSPWVRR